MTFHIAVHGSIVGTISSLYVKAFAWSDSELDETENSYTGNVVERLKVTQVKPKCTDRKFLMS